MVVGCKRWLYRWRYNILLFIQVFIVLVIIAITVSIEKAERETVASLDVITEYVQFVVENPLASQFTEEYTEVVDSHDPKKKKEIECNVTFKPESESTVMYSREHRSPAKVHFSKVKVTRVCDGKETIESNEIECNVTSNEIECNVTFKPESESTVMYSREHRSPAKVHFSKVKVTRVCEGKETIESNETDCKHIFSRKNAGELRLPINGRAVFGDAKHPMIGGQVLVFARTVQNVGPIELDFPPFYPRGMFLAYQMPLPGGTLVGGLSSDQKQGEPPISSPTGQSSGRLSSDPKRGEPPIWHGFINIGFESEDPGGIGMRAIVATNAKHLSVDLPVPNSPSERGGNAADPDVLPLTLFARVGGDVNLQILYGISGVLAWIAGFLRESFGKVPPIEKGIGDVIVKMEQKDEDLLHIHNLRMRRKRRASRIGGTRLDSSRVRNRTRTRFRT